MELVTRHIAANRILGNGVLCKKNVKKLTDIEIKVLYFPNYISYGIIKKSNSDENLSTYFIYPVISLIPCVDCLKILNT